MQGTTSTVLTFKDIDRTLLQGIPNPSGQAYEVRIKIPEFTKTNRRFVGRRPDIRSFRKMGYISRIPFGGHFLGVKEQPDFAVIYLTFYPGKKVIELRSLKHYVFQLRNIIISYQRLINIIYDDLMAIFEPERLRIVMVCNPRGGISSRLTIDSDWKARGGPEKFNDWQRIENEWDVLM